ITIVDKASIRIASSIIYFPYLTFRSIRVLGDRSYNVLDYEKFAECNGANFPEGRSGVQQSEVIILVIFPEGQKFSATMPKGKISG
ncbi:MAG: hypothetical protein U9M95_05670, partial [Candidatus Altiarchaeota archaeon]|nr:hypothetical protein [Candidatus Altiarchaeota archaeon]